MYEYQTKFFFIAQFPVCIETLANDCVSQCAMDKTEFKPNTCEAEYAKDPKIKKEDIKQLLDWVKTQPHLPDVKEYHIIQLYHVSNHSLVKTKRLIDIHYRFKNEAPEFFSGQDFQPPRYNHSYWDIIYIFEGSKPSPEGYRIVYFGLKDTDPSKYHVEVGTAMLIKIMLVFVLEQGICPGIAIVIDLEGSSIGHISTISLSFIRKFMYYIQEGVATRVKAVHIIHVNSLIEKMMTLTKPFMKRELMNMIHFHSNMDNFYNYIPRESMPVDLGGTYSHTKAELSQKLRTKVEAFEKAAQEELALRTNEKLRLNNYKNEKCETNESFKKLSID